MLPETFATHRLRPKDQLKAWREWYHLVFDIVPKQPTVEEFSGETRVWKLDGLVISRTSAPSTRVVRARSRLRRDPVDHWVISYCSRGARFAKAADTEVEVPAKVPFLWSLGQEFLYERTHTDWVQFFLAREAFRDIAPLLDGACGSTMDTALGGLLGDYMIALESRVAEVTEADFSRIGKAFGALVAAAVDSSAERMVAVRSQIDFSCKERVRQIVRRYLRTPTLEPKTLSRLAGLSRSNLYRLFEDTGGVARYIRRQRLLEAHDILSDPATTQPISMIAHDLCFADYSSFSRMFKQEFGYSPSEVCSTAPARRAPSATLGRRAPDQGDFNAVLRGL